MRIAIDAFNLRTERRSIGRYARGILARFRTMLECEVVLVTRDVDDAEAVALEEGLRAVTLGEARQERAYDAVWYPWNELHFMLHSATRITTIYDLSALTAEYSNVVARFRGQRVVRRALQDSHVVCALTQWSMAAIQEHRSAPVMLAQAAPAAFWHAGDDGAIHGNATYVVVLAALGSAHTAVALQAVERAFAGNSVDCILVEDTGERDDAALREIYRRAHAVLVPGMLGADGLAMLEAMACGAPVIAANHAALPEVADGAAVLLPPEDIDAWARAVRDIAFDDVKRRHLSGLGLRRIARLDGAVGARGIAAACEFAVQGVRS